MGCCGQSDRTRLSDTCGCVAGRHGERDKFGVTPDLFMLRDFDSMPFEKAPAGHVPLQIDSENPFVLIALALEDDSGTSAHGDWSSDLLNRFSRELQRCLGQLWNVGSHSHNADDFAYEDDLPVNVCSIVTDDPRLAHWYDRDRRNRVDLSWEHDILRIESRGTVKEFTPDELSHAVYFAAGMAAYFPDAEPADDDTALSQPITQAEFAGIEAILTQLQRAIQLGELTEAQQDQVQLMAQALQREQQSAEPGRTARRGLFHAVWFIVRMLRMLPLPDEFWVELADLLRSIGWLAMFGDLDD